MKAGESGLVAVLTGDIVKSRARSAGDPQGLGIALREAAETTATAFPNAGISKVDIFRGDSWQVLINNGKQALRAALFLRSFLRGGEARNSPSWETRLAIGIGSVDWVDEDQISQSQGPAFVTSGSALDLLAGSKRHMILRQAGTEEAPANQTVVSLLDALVQHWTSRQAWAVNGALRESWTQEQIGQSFVPPLQQRTVADHLRRADWDAVEHALHWWEKEWR